MARISEDLKNPKTRWENSYQDDIYTKVLSMEWNVMSDCFRPVISSFKVDTPLMKRMLVSNIAHLFDVLGWCSLTIILMKVLLQRVWEHNLMWDKPVPEQIKGAWKR